MSAAVEFIAWPGKTFIAQAYDPTSSDPAGSPVGGILDSGVASRYRFALDQTGIKFIKATATNLLVAGYVNLDAPADNGSCPIVDTYELAQQAFQLRAIKAKTDLIGTGAQANVSAPVAANGSLNPIIIGDDYLIVHSRAFVWTVPKPAGFNLTDATAWFGAKFNSAQKWLVSGSIADNGATLTLTFELPRARTISLKPGNYDWSTAVHDAAGRQITTVISGDNAVKLVPKFT